MREICWGVRTLCSWPRLEDVRTRRGQVRNLPVPQQQHQYPVLDTDRPRPKPRSPHAREIASTREYLEIHKLFQGGEWLNFVPRSGPRVSFIDEL